MKSLFVPIAIVFGLIFFFYMIDRRDFARYDMDQNERTERSVSGKKPMPDSTTAPRTLSEGRTADESKSAEEWKNGIERKAAENELKEDVALNKEETTQEAMPGDHDASKDYLLAYSDDFKVLAAVSLSKNNEKLLSEKGYDLSAFRKNTFPKSWSVDFSNIPPDVSFQAADDGYHITSDHGVLRITGQRFNSMRSSFVMEVTVENNGNEESDFSLGINNSGFIKNGNTILVPDVIPEKGKKTLKVEINVFDRFANVAPVFEIRGSIILKEFKIYRKDFDNFTIVEGEITERSKLPDPKKSDYPNCRYTAHFVGNAILSGMPCNKELCLSIDGFENQKVLKTNSIKPGDRVRCAIVPMDSIPDELASIQEADDLSLFALDSYLVTTLQKISSFTDISTANGNNAIVFFKSDSFDFKSVFGRINEPIPEELKEAQKKRIEKDLGEAEEMIRYLEKNREDIELRFQKAWAAERKRDEQGYNRVGKLVWRKVNNSFWGLNNSYTLIPKTPHILPKDKIDAMVALKNFLESNGIQLIVSLVPDRFEISSRVINPEFTDVPVYQLASYVKQLSEAGVECPYHAKRIIDNYDSYPFGYLFPLDHHPGSTVQQCISEIIAERLSDYQFPKTLDKNRFSHVQVATYDDDNNGKVLHKYPENCDIGDHTPGVFYESDEIRYDGERVVRDTSSEILVIGNSYAYTPGSASKQHSLPAHIAETMLHPIDDYMVSSHGPMTVIIQRFFEKPEFFLSNKKVLILQMAESHLQENNIVWNNIAEMDRRKLMLNGKKMIAALSVQGNGDWTSSITDDLVRTVWGNFAGKVDYMCRDDETNTLFDQTISDLDTSKPFVCVVQTVRSLIYSSPALICNGVEAIIPASYGSSALFWQDVYFQVPAGTNQLKLEVQGKAGTLVGFNKVLIYQ